MNLSLTLGCGFYDRTIYLQNGMVRPEGIELNFVPLWPGELFRRQARHAEFDVAELSFSTFTILFSRGDRRFVGIPVFPSRKFRHSEIYINTKAGIVSAQDLAGKRIGVAEYQQTAAVWMRAFLQHDFGVAPGQVHWFFGGYNEPEHYTERIPMNLPPGVEATTIDSETCMNDMLEAGELDALMGPEQPRAFLEGSPNVARLFPDYPQVELDYFRRTGFFPIMHTVVMRRDIYDRAPWAATSLFKAFALAKAMARRRIQRSGALFAMAPWLIEELEETEAKMGVADPFIYGLEANRRTLEALVGFNHEQGLIDQVPDLEEMFAPETHDLADDAKYWGMVP